MLLTLKNKNDGHTMMYYSIICRDTKDSHTKRQVLRKAHTARLEQLRNQKRLLVAGPYFEKDNTNHSANNILGSIIIAQFSSLAEAKSWIAADPFVTAEVYCNITVNTFKPIE